MHLLFILFFIGCIHFHLHIQLLKLLTEKAWKDLLVLLLHLNKFSWTSSNQSQKHSWLPPAGTTTHFEQQHHVYLLNAEMFMPFSPSYKLILHIHPFCELSWFSKSCLNPSDNISPKLLHLNGSCLWIVSHSFPRKQATYLERVRQQCCKSCRRTTGCDKKRHRKIRSEQAGSNHCLPHMEMQRQLESL